MPILKDPFTSVPTTTTSAAPAAPTELAMTSWRLVANEEAVGPGRRRAQTMPALVEVEQPTKAPDTPSSVSTKPGADYQLFQRAAT